ncbi:MAG TPA: hypothetical protein VGX21_22620, partial [Methylomirabilota bacterium]|nr:hypothetical protein [Methylomirabilota bacterium]
MRRVAFGTAAGLLGVAVLGVAVQAAADDPSLPRALASGLLAALALPLLAARLGLPGRRVIQAFLLLIWLAGLPLLARLSPPLHYHHTFDVDASPAGRGVKILAAEGWTQSPDGLALEPGQRGTLLLRLAPSPFRSLVLHAHLYRRWQGATFTNRVEVSTDGTTFEPVGADLELAGDPLYAVGTGRVRPVVLRVTATNPTPVSVLVVDDVRLVSSGLAPVVLGIFAVLGLAFAYGASRLRALAGASTAVESALRAMGPGPEPRPPPAIRPSRQLLLVAAGVLAGLAVFGPRLGVFRAEHVTFQSVVEDFNNGSLRDPRRLIQRHGFHPCADGFCLAEKTAGELILAYPMPPAPQVVMRLWFYGSPRRLANRVAVSADEGQTWIDVLRDRDLNNAVVDVSRLIPPRHRGVLWVKLAAENGTGHEALVVDRLEVAASDSPAPTRLPDLAAMFRLVVLPLGLAAGLAPWIGPGRGIAGAILGAAGLAAGAAALGPGDAVVGWGTWGLLAASLIGAAGGGRGGRWAGDRRACLATVACSLVLCWAFAARWAEFVRIYRFPVADDALMNLGFMRTFAWGSASQGFYSAGLSLPAGVLEPLFIAVGATFFMLTGASDLALRLLTLLLSVAGVWLTYVAGRRLLGSAVTGLVGASLVAGSTYLIYDAVRGFRTGFELCLVLLLAIALWPTPGRSSWRQAVGGGVVGGLLCLQLLAHLPGVVVTLASTPWTVTGWRRRLLRVGAALGVVGLLLGPFLVASKIRRGAFFASNPPRLVFFFEHAREMLPLKNRPDIVEIRTTTAVVRELGAIFAVEGGWLWGVTRGYALAIRDACVLAAGRYYWVALAGLAALALGPARFMVLVFLLSMANSAPLYGVAARPVPDAIAF